MPQPPVASNSVVEVEVAEFRSGDVLEGSHAAAHGMLHRRIRRMALEGIEIHAAAHGMV
jgi:hypothetical protein